MPRRANACPRRRGRRHRLHLRDGCASRNNGPAPDRRRNPRPTPPFSRELLARHQPVSARRPLGTMTAPVIIEISRAHRVLPGREPRCHRTAHLIELDTGEVDYFESKLDYARRTLWAGGRQRLRRVSLRDATTKRCDLSAAATSCRRPPGRCCTRGPSPRSRPVVDRGTDDDERSSGTFLSLPRRL